MPALQLYKHVVRELLACYNYQEYFQVIHWKVVALTALSQPAAARGLQDDHEFMNNVWSGGAQNQYPGKLPTLPSQCNMLASAPLHPIPPASFRHCPLMTIRLYGMNLPAFATRYKDQRLLCLRGRRGGVLAEALQCAAGLH